jgi:hypothetical protein
MMQQNILLTFSKSKQYGLHFYCKQLKDFYQKNTINIVLIYFNLTRLFNQERDTFLSIRPSLRQHCEAGHIFFSFFFPPYVLVFLVFNSIQLLCSLKSSLNFGHRNYEFIITHYALKKINETVLLNVLVHQMK